MKLRTLLILLLAAVLGLAAGNAFGDDGDSRRNIPRFSGGSFDGFRDQRGVFFDRRDFFDRRPFVDPRFVRRPFVRRPFVPFPFLRPPTIIILEDEFEDDFFFFDD